MIYYIWMKRNSRCFGKENLTKEIIKVKIKEVVKERATPMSNIKKMKSLMMLGISQGASLNR